MLTVLVPFPKQPKSGFKLQTSQVTSKGIVYHSITETTLSKSASKQAFAPIVKSSFPCVKPSPRVTRILLRTTPLLCSQISISVFTMTNCRGTRLRECLLRAKRRWSRRGWWRHITMRYELLVDRCVLHWPAITNLALRE